MSTDAAPPGGASDGWSGKIWSEASGPVGRRAVVLVHGSMDRSAGLLRLGRRLSGDFRVIRYDRRGYGRSRDTGPPFTVADNVTDLANVVEQHAGSTGACLVFGHSFGGNIALALAEQRPDLVARVVVYETPLSWIEWWPEGTAGGAALAQADPADAAEAFMRRLVGDDKWERLPSSTRASRRAEGPAMVGELADLRSRPPWDGAAIDQPVLAMFGERARPHHRNAVEAITTMIPRARTVMIPGAGHVGPNTHTNEVSAAVLTFLAETTPPSG